MSYKFHHKGTGRQLPDDKTLLVCEVRDGDVLRLQPEITAGRGGCHVARLDEPLSVSSGPKPMSDRIHIAATDEEDRFARFQLISWWDQVKLTQARVLLIGVGALGNEILKNLALLGVCQVFVADLDLVANLQTKAFGPVPCRGLRQAWGRNVAAGAAPARSTRTLRVRPFHGNVVYDLGLGVFRPTSFWVGFDNREARVAINLAAGGGPKDLDRRGHRDGLSGVAACARPGHRTVLRVQPASEVDFRQCRALAGAVPCSHASNGSRQGTHHADDRLGDCRRPVSLPSPRTSSPRRSPYRVGRHQDLSCCAKPSSRSLCAAAIAALISARWTPLPWTRSTAMPEPGRRLRGGLA